MMNQSKRLLIDNRTSEDILGDIRKKASSYTPEWDIDVNNPDIGYALSMVFARQMEENIDSVNQILDNYHTEFTNMLDISPKSARPAGGFVEFGISIDTIPGTYVPKGTKLRSNAEEPIVYETQNSVYVTGSKLVSMFMVDGEDGFVRPLRGRFEVPKILPENNAEEEGEDKNFYNQKEFRLFGEDDSITENTVFFYHGSLVNTGTNPVFVKIEGSKRIVESIVEGNLVFKWFSSEGLVEFEKIELLEDEVTFKLIRDDKNEIETVVIGGKEYFVIVLESIIPITENMPVSQVTFSSKGEPQPIGFVTNGNLDLEANSFAPFGEELAPYSQCYIGMENYFQKDGARIDIDFDVIYKDHTYEIFATGQDNSNDLRVIKKKPKIRSIDIPADCVVNEISLEYFNGNGWKKLETANPVMSMFENLNHGKYSISFMVPEDWKSNDVGAYSGRTLKLQITRTDNCYMRPGVHHYPVINNCMVSYSYEDKYITPKMVKSIVGTKSIDLSKLVYEGKQFNLFASTEYFNDALYMGFSKPFENGPISMMFEIEERFNYKELKYIFEYSSSNGFKQMKVLDHTKGMTRTGMVTFLPQADMAKTTVEGKRLYWIRLVRNKSLEKENRKLLPIVKDIRLNVVKVENINILDERDIYITSVNPGQVIDLHENDILDVELWVNEQGYIGMYELEALERHHPEDVRIEYDSTGNMAGCFIRYKECNSFKLAKDKRVYILDRINGEVIFGDGVSTSTPKVVDTVAAKLTIRQSQGSRGNTEPGTITGAVGNLLYIDEINNPLRVYNGSDMENTDNVLERGSLLLQARNRLLSADDYKKEIVLFTDAVKDMEIICELLKNGKTNPLALSCVLLLNDYDVGRGSFQQIAEGIKSHLLDNCEITVNSDNLHIVEPIFVEISVDIWAESVNIDESFELQNILKDDLEEYLSPLNGWKIGTLPKPSQIMMRLNVLKSKAVIKKSIIIAKYTDQDGEHEMDIKNVKITPYMICKSGQHNVHVILSN